MLDLELLCCTTALLLIYILEKQKKKSVLIKKRKWSKNRLRKRSFSHINLLAELKLKKEDWFNHLRIDEETYFKLLQTVKPLIKKEGKANSSQEQLIATLRFLAMGRSNEDLQVLNDTIPKTCNAIYKSLKNKYLKFPTTQEEWKKIANEFERKWNFPHCLGVLDGRHIEIVPPSDSGSYFRNHKERHSLVLVAIANANYEFIMCDFGTNGMISDGDVLEGSNFYDLLIENALKIPNHEQASNSNVKLPYVFVGDEAFNLQTNLLVPYSQDDLTNERRIFNDRLSITSQIIENVFGILTTRFGIFHTPIDLEVDNIDIVVLTCCALHNFLRRNCADTYTESGLIEETNRGTLLNLERGYTYAFEDAELVRDMFMQYFNNEKACSMAT